MSEVIRSRVGTMWRRLRPLPHDFPSSASHFPHPFGILRSRKSLCRFYCGNPTRRWGLGHDLSITDVTNAPSNIVRSMGHDLHNRIRHCPFRKGGSLFDISTATTSGLSRDNVKGGLARRLLYTSTIRHSLTFFLTIFNENWAIAHIWNALSLLHCVLCWLNNRESLQTRTLWSLIFGFLPLVS